MPISVSEAFGIPKEAFDATGALDILLDLDSRLYIDPHVLQAAETPELQGSYDTFRDHFTKLLKVLRASKQKGDAAWRAADELLNFPEVQGLCLGYGKSGTAGSGMGPGLRAHILETAKLVVDAGIDDPEIFELIGLFEEGIGANRVCDMTARIIRTHLYAYTERVFAGLGIENVETVDVEGYTLSRNPQSGKPIILVPKEVLQALPIATSWEDVDTISFANEKLRRQLNETIGRTWKQAQRRLKKHDLRAILLDNPSLLRDLLAKYKAKPRSKHDFEEHPAGEAILHELAVEFVQQAPLALALSVAPTPDEVLGIVQQITQKFQQHIEYHNGWRALYKPNGKPQHEEIAQILFYMVADAYCEANNLDLSREPNAGRGPVDFKVAGGYATRVLVEVKLSSNTKLVHGFEVQVEEYTKAEGAQRAVLLVIDVGYGGNWHKRLQDAANKARGAGKRVPEIAIVDGRPKPPASKA